MAVERRGDRARLPGVAGVLFLACLCLSAPVGASGLATIYSFTGTDGNTPNGKLATDGDGRLFGATQNGGAIGVGAIFMLAPNSRAPTGWAETVIHSFDGFDGGNPYGGLVVDTQGVVYGSSSGGGKNFDGTIFALTPRNRHKTSWTYKNIFQGNAAADNPEAGLIMDDAGVIYATTIQGGANAGCPNCGEVFALVPPTGKGAHWSKKTLHSFAGGTDGITPLATLTMDAAGNLFGTTQGGGGSSSPACAVTTGCGVIFKLTPAPKGPWAETIIHDFNDQADGNQPGGSVVIDPSTGALLGTTDGGTDGNGTIFQVGHPEGPSDGLTFATIHAFAGKPDGAAPLAGLTQVDSNTYYGTTTGGGKHDWGTIFKMERGPISQMAFGPWQVKVVYSFTGGADGGIPSGDLLLLDGKLYGTTELEGDPTCQCGTVFEFTP